MAAPKTKLNKRQQDSARAAIQTTKLVKRLQDFVLEKNESTGKPIEIDSARLRAIEILLRKSLPDLQNITLGGDEDNPVAVTQIKRAIVRPDNSNG